MKKSRFYLHKEILLKEIVLQEKIIEHKFNKPLSLFNIGNSSSFFKDIGITNKLLNTYIVNFLGKSFVNTSIIQLFKTIFK